MLFFLRTTCLILIIIMITAGGVIAQQNDTYTKDVFYRVQIDLKSQDYVKHLTEIGVSIGHVHIHDNGRKLIAELSGYDLNLMKAEKVDFDVLVEDVSAFYVQAAIADLAAHSMESILADAPDNFELGSMGGHKTLAEAMEDLDAMVELFPDLITEKFSIGQSIEGREIWAIWIGKDFDEDKPQALYTSLIHAREPNSMMAVIYYMWWLLENYGEDETATFILNNRHLAFIPVLNPDGYEYNRINNPNGGGMHRKNRRPVGSWPQGIDLNRNFGPFQFWDHSNGGSSTNPNSETYRGIAPFSEPETAALRNFVNENDFRTAFNYHTFSNLLIYPYGALQRVTADHHVFLPYAQEMTEFNNYEYGTDQETVGYNTRGNSDDWMYGLDEGGREQDINIIAFTPEVGGWSDYFWPVPSRIVPLSQENLHPNKLLAIYAGPELHFDESMVPVPDTDVLDRGQPTFLSFTFDEIYNYGRFAADVEMVLHTSHEGVIVHDNPVIMQTIDVDETWAGLSNAFEIELEPWVAYGETIELTLELRAPWTEQNPAWDYTFTTQGSATDIGQEPELPQEATLRQNYPNPFNPGTQIIFTVGQGGNVTLDVFDTLGRKVQNLVNENLSSGEYRIDFDASALPSGVYIYRLQAADQVLIRKMTLTK